MGLKWGDTKMQWPLLSILTRQSKMLAMQCQSPNLYLQCKAPRNPNWLQPMIVPPNPNYVYSSLRLQHLTSDSQFMSIESMITGWMDGWMDMYFFLSQTIHQLERPKVGLSGNQDVPHVCKWITILHSSSSPPSSSCCHSYHELPRNMLSLLYVHRAD